MKWLRAPGLHFVLLGSALFLLRTAWLPDDPPEADLLRVSLAQQRELAQRLSQQIGRPPTGEELEAAVEDWIDEELLFRQALALGWNRSDPVVQRRLLQNQRFLESGEEAEPQELLDEAFRLGMDRSDVVVRRRLVERVRLALTARVRQAQPPDAALAALLQQQPERFRQPARLRLAQVFLSRDRRGDGLEADARNLLAAIRRSGEGPEQAARRGDPFPLPTELPLWSEAELASRLGADFARAVQALPLERWEGPVTSAYGAHLVWLRERRAGRPASLEEARRELQALWREQQERSALRAALAKLRARTVIDIERPVTGRAISGPARSGSVYDGRRPGRG